MSSTLFTAKLVVPITGPPIPDGAVVVDAGAIVEVGDAVALGARHRQATAHELGDAVLLPGLVNPHVHLELTAIGQLPRPASFVDWLLALRQQLIARPADALEQLLTAGCEAGLAQCLRWGVTTVGDITANPLLSRSIFQRSPIKGVSFGEIRAMAQRSYQFDGHLDAAFGVSNATPSRVRPGLSPHAPYSVDLCYYGATAKLAREFGLPMATHLAETPDEAEFLTQHTGEFRRLWHEVGGWNDEVSRAEGGPIRAMRSVGLFDGPVLLAHVNYIDDAELDILQSTRASVVYCPRTHAYFGHRPHRFGAMLARGINVAIGTDSTASSPDLNLVEDLRLVHRLDPDFDVHALWEMVTLRAARALQMDEHVGALAPGRSADLVAFPSRGRDPLRAILEDPGCHPVGVWIDGRQVA